jgi:DNA-binding IclR family transcriptional regulator
MLYSKNDIKHSSKLLEFVNAVFSCIRKMTDEVQSTKRGGQSPLDRYFSILEIVASHPGASVPEIAELSGLPFPTAHRLLKGLRAEGLLVGDKRKAHELGPRLLRLLQAGTDEPWIRITGQKILDQVAQSVAITSYLAKLRHDQVVSVAWATPAGGLKGYVIPGLAQPLHAAACAKAILAEHDEPFVRSLIKDPLQKLAPNTLTRYEDLLAELKTTKTQGYATCINENEPGITAIACPILLPRTGVMYSIGVMALSDQVRQKQFAEIASILQQAAAELATTVPSEQI